MRPGLITLPSCATHQMCERNRCHVRPVPMLSSGGCLVETRRIVGILATRRAATMAPMMKKCA